MSSATSTAMQRTAAAQRTTRPMAAPQMAQPQRTLGFGNDEAAILKVDLSDIHVPQVGGLQIDGFKPSFFARLFGRK
jgi:hypothetical protein